MFDAVREQVLQMKELIIRLFEWFVLVTTAQHTVSFCLGKLFEGICRSLIICRSGLVDARREKKIMGPWRTLTAPGVGPPVPNVTRQPLDYYALSNNVENKTCRG